jgi:MFS family permease
MFIGFAVGPTFGSFVIHATGSTISIFYVAACFHFVYALVMWFVLPESVSAARQRYSAAKYHSELNLAQQDREASTSKVLVHVTRLFAFLSPLSIFSPRIPVHGGNPLKSRKKNWNLTLLALGFGFTISVMVR